MTKAFISTLTAVLLCTSAANAHHGTSAHFDHDKDILVEGVVSEMKFVNPHSYLYFDVAVENGAAVPWRCEMVEAGTLRRAGLTNEILAPGTIVRVHGKPARREDAVCYLEEITLTDGTTISHRGQIASGGDAFTPSAASQAIDATSSSDDTIILASGGNDAANRTIVPVPTEGIFGHWADGNRYLLSAGTRNEGQARGNGARGAGGGMAGGGAGGMGTGGMGAGAGARGTGGMGAGGGAMGAGGMAGGAGGNAVVEDADASVQGRNPRPQYNDAGLALANRYDASYDNPALACSASVLFGLGHHGLPNEFVQLSDKELRLTYGYMDMVRTIHVDGSFPAAITPSTSGYSVGKWDGDDTLIVTTKGFKPDVLFAFAGGGNGLSTINSDKLEVTESFAYDEATDTISLKWTATDAGYWTAPLSGERTLNRSTAYNVYGCVELAGENNLRDNGETLFGVIPAAAQGQLGSNSGAMPTKAKNSSSLFYVTGGALLLGLLGLIGLTYKRSGHKQS